MSAPDLVDLDLYVHERRDRSALVSRFGDRSQAAWLALAHLDIVMKGDTRALVTLPRWLAIQEGLIQPRDGEEQPNLFGRP